MHHFCLFHADRQAEVGAGLSEFSKMLTLRNARSLAKSMEMPSGPQLAMKCRSKLFCLLPFEKCIVLQGYNGRSKMPTVRNALSLVTSRELPSGLQFSGKSPVVCIVLCGYNER